MKKYKFHLVEWEKNGFGGQDCEFLVCENKKARYDGYQASKLFLNSAKGKYVVLVHEDSHPRMTKKALLKILEDLEKLDPGWAMVGNAGIQQEKMQFVNLGLAMPDALPSRAQPNYVKVGSLDENLLIVKAEARLCTSRDLAGFHLYGLDLCDLAHRMGYTCYVAKVDWYHDSHGKLDAEFCERVGHFENKMMAYRKQRILGTTCTFLSWSSSPFFVAWARAQAYWLLRKNKYHGQEERRAVWQAGRKEPLFLSAYFLLWLSKKIGL